MNLCAVIKPAHCLNNVIWILIKEAFRVQYLCLYMCFRGVCSWYILCLRSQNCHVIGIPMRMVNFEKEQVDWWEIHSYKGRNWKTSLWWWGWVVICLIFRLSGTGMDSNVGSYSEQVFDSNNVPLNWMVSEPSTGGRKRKSCCWQALSNVTENVRAKCWWIETTYFFRTENKLGKELM